MKPMSKKVHLGCESNEEVEEEMRGFWLLKAEEELEDDLMGWSERWRGSLHVSLVNHISTSIRFYLSFIDIKQEDRRNKVI